MIRLSKSVVGTAEKDALASVIDASYLGIGEFVFNFEEKLKEYLEVKHAICVNSGTAALHLALMGIGLEKDDEVLVQSLTFIASFQAISAVGAKPVACEIIPETCTIDLKDAERRLTGKTKAIMPVHYASRVGNLDEIYKFAGKYGLKVIEDAAHAFGTIYKGEKVGSSQLLNYLTTQQFNKSSTQQPNNSTTQPLNFPSVACFSFDGIKNITSGEGGAVVTDDDRVAEIVMNARLLGVEKDTEKRYQGLRSWEFDVTHQGYRYHMSNLFAAIGMVQLERLEKEFKPKRQMLAKRYYEALKDVQNIVLFRNDYDEIIPHIFPIRVLNNKRDGLRQHLLDNNIECGAHYLPNHLLTFYNGRRGLLPVTEQIYSELLSIPLHPDLDEKNQDYIIKKIKMFFNKK